MILLAFDTSMSACSAAVYDGAERRVIASRFARMDRGHADALAPMLADIMREARTEFAALERIGVTIGPGTFTGVRTGIAMARGLALALGIKIIGIDTLTAIACNAPEETAPLVIAADARRGEVYFLDPASGGQSAVLPVTEALRRLPAARAIVLGTGAEALMAAAPPGRLVHAADGDLPDARNFAALCASREPGAAPPEPLYLRPPDAKPQGGVALASGGVSIRAAAAAEAQILAALHAECFDNSWTAADFARLMAMPGAVALLAIEGEEPCAFLLARHAAGEMEILTIGTRPYARRQGLARKLLTRLERQLLATGVRELFIEVAAGNAPGRALYERDGFTVTGARRAYYERPGGRREDAIVMMKVVAP